MKKVFLDTNIIIDLLADRPPNSKFAIEIFKQAENRKIKLYTSSHIFATTHYLLEKYIEERTLRNLLNNLLDYINIVAVDLPIIKKALKSKHKDFEDAIQIFSAQNIAQLFCIVTRNKKYFKDADIEIMLPEELLKTILK